MTAERKKEIGKGGKTMIRQTIIKLTEGRDLDEREAGGAMGEIMRGEATEAQIAAYLTALAMKGETVEEITASARTMREYAVKTDIPPACMDIVGTGGDRSNSFNISTCSAFIVAAGGVKVAKHGNRSVSSKCGAADVLEMLGANLKTSPEKTARIFERCGFAFLHAQVYHPAMKFAAPVRAQLGIRTVFNLLGPLANPAGAKTELLGVYSREMLVPLATVLSNLGTTRVIAVHGEEGLDEVSPSGKTYCCEIFGGKKREYTLTPADFGLEPHALREITGGDPEENARIMKSVLAGERGAYRDAAVANSALAFCAAGAADDVYRGARYAEQLLDSGKAEEVMKSYVAATGE